MLKAVIFDMDGVLVDSEPLNAKVTVLTLKHYGINISTDYCYGFIGSTTLNMLENIILDFNLPLSSDELEITYNQCKQQLIKIEGYEAIPYTKELIIDLYENGVKLAIASSSTLMEIQDVVEALEISRYFHKLISGATVDNPKPAPDVFLKAMKELEVNNTECIVIEDSYNGVRAAEAAGIPVLGFVNLNSGIQDLSKACILIEGFDEINYKFLERTYLRANGKPITIAITDRLIIRELAVDDIANVYQIYQNPEVRTYIDDIDEYLEIEIDKHQAYIKNVYNFYGYGLWGVFHKDTGRLIGRCGIQNKEINGMVEIELGYLLDSKYWGQGYAIECNKAILKYAFEELNLPRIVAVIDELNTRSIKVAKRIGMKRKSEFSKNKSHYLLYSIEMEENHGTNT